MIGIELPCQCFGHQTACWFIYWATVLLFKAKYRIRHPENYLFLLSKKYIFWIKASKKHVVWFKKQKHCWAIHLFSFYIDTVLPGEFVFRHNLIVFLDTLILWILILIIESVKILGDWPNQGCSKNNNTVGDTSAGAIVREWNAWGVDI